MYCTITVCTPNSGSTRQMPAHNKKHKRVSLSKSVLLRFFNWPKQGDICKTFFCSLFFLGNHESQSLSFWQNTVNQKATSRFPPYYYRNRAHWLTYSRCLFKIPTPYGSVVPHPGSQQQRGGRMRKRVCASFEESFSTGLGQLDHNKQLALVSFRENNAWWSLVWCHVVRGCVVIEVKFMNHLSLYESLDTLGYYCQDDDDDAGESVRGPVPGPGGCQSNAYFKSFGCFSRYTMICRLDWVSHVVSNGR